MGLFSAFGKKSVINEWKKTDVYNIAFPPLIIGDFKSPVTDDNVDVLFSVEKVDKIRGRGLILHGTVQKGSINKGDPIYVLHDEYLKSTDICDLAIDGQRVEYVNEGAKCSLLLKPVVNVEAFVGDKLITPNKNADFEPDMPKPLFKEIK